MPNMVPGAFLPQSCYGQPHCGCRICYRAPAPALVRAEQCEAGEADWEGGGEGGEGEGVARLVVVGGVAAVSRVRTAHCPQAHPARQAQFYCHTCTQVQIVSLALLASGWVCVWC